MSKLRLQDEVATNQERQLQQLELSDECDAEDDEPTWGSDPFEILARLEEEQGHPVRSH